MNDDYADIATRITAGCLALQRIARHTNPDTREMDAVEVQAIDEQVNTALASLQAA